MKPSATLLQDIQRLLPGRCGTDVRLSQFTSFGIGGPADIVAEPEHAGALADLIKFLHHREVPKVVLGAGTNVLFPDSGFRGVVIRTVYLKDFQLEKNGVNSARVTAGAGLNLFALIGRTCKSGLSGMEPLWGIPGSVGGALAVNAGSGGVCASDFLEQMRLLNSRGKTMTVRKEDLDWAYRRVTLPPDAVIVDSTFRLSRGEADSIKKQILAANRLRRMKQPWRQPSAGCIFKNPSTENPAGALIDRLGFKGTQVGGAQVSQIHANFIVNRGNASANDVLNLVERIRRRAKEAEGIDLELEICVMTQGPTNE